MTSRWFFHETNVDGFLLRFFTETKVLVFYHVMITYYSYSCQVQSECLLKLECQQQCVIFNSVWSIDTHVYIVKGGVIQKLGNYN